MLALWTQLSIISMKKGMNGFNDKLTIFGIFKTIFLGICMELQKNMWKHTSDVLYAYALKMWTQFYKPGESLRFCKKQWKLKSIKKKFYHFKKICIEIADQKYICSEFS